MYPTGGGRGGWRGRARGGGGGWRGGGGGWRGRGSGIAPAANFQRNETMQESQQLDFTLGSAVALVNIQCVWQKFVLRGRGTAQALPAKNNGCKFLPDTLIGSR